MSRSFRRSGNLNNPNEDDMANGWGSGLVEDNIAAGATRIRLDSEIKTAVPGFRLLDVVESGTTANERAISMATGGSFSSCLIGMGSYVGGLGVLEALTSTQATSNWQLSLVKNPEDCSVRGKCQTVPLPYHIPHSSLDSKKLLCFEDRCLHAIKIRLASAALSGQPYKAFLLEYMLSGTGGELSFQFLEQLAITLRLYNVIIIADEIMTGGRVGPTIAVTSRLSPVFIQTVGLITLGKVFGCGLVLEKNLSTKEQLAARGTTTEIHLDEPFGKLVAIRARMEGGMIERKRAKVLAKLKLTDPDKVWGKGLLMFTSKCRPAVTRNLRNRLLPQLEDNNRTKLTLGLKDTAWNRVVVNEHLFGSIEKWLQHSSTYYASENISPYAVQLATYVCNNTKEPVSTITAVDVLQFIESSGYDGAAMVNEHRAALKRRLGCIAGRSSKGHINLVHESLSAAMELSNGFVTRHVKQKKRKLCYELRYDNI